MRRLRLVPLCVLLGALLACSGEARERPSGASDSGIGPQDDAGTTVGPDGAVADTGTTAPTDGGGGGEDGGVTDTGGGGGEVQPYATFYGGGGSDGLRAIATDAAGNVYIAGGTDSANLPRAVNAFAGGEYDVFVAKYDRDGRLIWTRYLGGPGYERAYALAVDAQGFLYVGGRAGFGFPVTDGVFQTSFGGSTPGNIYPEQDGFVAKLDNDGGLVWASYYGAFEPREAGGIVRGLALDSAGNVLVASASFVGDYSATSRALQDSFLNQHAQPNATWDTVVSKISNDGTRVLWSRYIGGRGDESTVPSVAVGANDAVVLLTSSFSTGPGVTTPGVHQPTLAGAQDFLVTKLDANGGVLFATFVGGSGEETLETHNVAVAANDDVIIAATTTSGDFPTTGGAYDPTYNGGGGSGNNNGDVVVARLSADGRSLVAATYVGGATGDGAEGVVLDPDGNIHLCGTTQSGDFPTTADAYQPRYSGGSDDMIYVQLSGDLSTLRYATLFGGAGGYNIGRAAGLDPATRSFYFGGESSASLPVFNAEQSDFAGREDTSLVRLLY